MIAKKLQSSDTSSMPNPVKAAEQFGRENPELAAALELFRVTSQQYAAAIRPLNRSEIRVSNSTSEE